MKYFDHTDSDVVAISNADERRVIAALRASQIGVFEFEPQTDTAFWDDRVRDLWGITGSDKITYEIVLGQVHPDDRALHDGETAKALDPDGDGTMDMIYRIYPKDGRPMRWVRAKAGCLFEDGKAIRLLGTVQDITEEHTARLRNKALLNELEHRVKNTLATAVAVVSLSRRGASNMQSYFTAVDERIRNLSVSHDLLHKTDWTAVQFKDLFSKSAQSFLGSDWDKGRIKLDADDIIIPARYVMTTSMALHELMTNAAKYGALSTDTGIINAGFKQTGPHVMLYWYETGGQKPQQDVTYLEGFGTVLLKNIFPGEFGGKAQLAYSDDGLRYEVTQFPVVGAEA